MNEAGAARIRLGMATFPVGGLIGLAGILLRGPYGTPLAGPERWAAAASAPTFVPAHFLILIGYVLPFLGFWALYTYLSGLGAERSAFWGFMLSLWGTALALPAMGVAAFAGPLAAGLATETEGRAAALIAGALTGPGFYVGIAAAVCYVIGPGLYGLAAWRTRRLPAGAALLFAIHGLLLSFGFGFFPLLILGWACLIVSGAWMALRIRA